MYILEEARLRNNLRIISDVAKRANVEIILAFKAYALWKTFPIFREYINSTTASSLSEARLAFDKFGSKAHTFSPAYTDYEIDEIAACSSHLTFNSLTQYERLHETARKQNLPAYVIFQDVSLEQMATMYPVKIEELRNIQGIGVGKANRYGKPFCELISQYCKDNEIERPEELFVRTVAKDSMKKVKIIQYLDRRMPLDDIASALGLDFEDLLNDLDAIVYSGTKLNIDYFLEDVMDEDQIDDIYEYFRESDTDDIDTALDELGDYEENEIRLVRIKFLSEQAN